MQLGIVSLWSLLESCRTGSEAEQLQFAEAALQTGDVGCRELVIRIEDSALLVDGQPVASRADRFAATHGLVSFLRDGGIAQVRFAACVDAEGLLRWAQQVVGAELPAQWPNGIEVEHVSADAAGSAAPTVAGAQACGAPSDSRLRSVFLQHRLIAGLPAIEGVDPSIAKSVVQEVVDRLLQVSGGLEPLMLLQQDEELLQRSTGVAVLVVLFARRAGWPLDRLVDLGAAGLLHDIGSVLDADDPGGAGFRWLLERGHSDFWLRSALVARRWRDGAAASHAAAGPLAMVALVRLAVAARDGAQRVDEVVANGYVPDELGAVARHALAW